MKKELSAGGVVVRKKGNAWQVLLLKDMNDNWTFPKGLIEKGENPPSAAKREIADEKLRPQKEEGISEAKWLTFPKALKVICYAKTNKPLLVEAKKVL